jgi:hypothetical protein
MTAQWFARRGWFAIPTSVAGVVLTLLTVLFVVQVFVAVDRKSHSASDTLYGVFPFAVCSFLLLDWVAERTGAARNRDQL